MTAFENPSLRKGSTLNPRPRYGAGLLLLAAAVAALLFLGGGMQLPFASGEPGRGDDHCLHYLAYDTDNSGVFGPAVQSRNKSEVLDAFFDAPECDPIHAAQRNALVAGLINDPGDNADVSSHLTAVANNYIANPAMWEAQNQQTSDYLRTCQSSLESRSGSYETLTMRKGANSNEMPTVGKIGLNRSSFDVLVFHCPGGTTFVFKLNCHFQPVAQYFNITPRPGTPQQPHNPPPGGHTPTTRPHYGTTTTQPHTVCTTFPCGKPPVPPAPHQCQLSQNQCDPGDGPSTPRPADPVRPTATTSPPPPTTVPPPAPPPSQPPQTTPVTSPVTAPA